MVAELGAELAALAAVQIKAELKAQTVTVEMALVLLAEVEAQEVVQAEEPFKEEPALLIVAGTVLGAVVVTLAVAVVATMTVAVEAQEAVDQVILQHHPVGAVLT